MAPPISTTSSMGCTSGYRMSSSAAFVRAPVQTSLRRGTALGSAPDRRLQRLQRPSAQPGGWSRGAGPACTAGCACSAWRPRPRAPDALRPLLRLRLLVPGAADGLEHRDDRLDRGGLLRRGRQQRPACWAVQPRVAVDLGAQDGRGPDQGPGLPRVHLCRAARRAGAHSGGPGQAGAAAALDRSRVQHGGRHRARAERRPRARTYGSPQAGQVEDVQGGPADLLHGLVPGDGADAQQTDSGVPPCRSAASGVLSDGGALDGPRDSASAGRRDGGLSTAHARTSQYDGHRVIVARVAVQPNRHARHGARVGTIGVAIGSV
jgi:hypothetical protein